MEQAETQSSVWMKKWSFRMLNTKGTVAISLEPVLFDINSYVLSINSGFKVFLKELSDGICMKLHLVKIIYIFKQYVS